MKRLCIFLMVMSVNFLAYSSNIPMESLGKPTPSQIQADLIGHSLSEGVDDGYYPSYWKWRIEKGEISNFRVISVDKDTPNEYEVTATMRLTSLSGRAFDATVKVYYVSRGGSGWHLEFVRSLGMNTVRTGRYDGCITSEYDDWLEATVIRNNCEIPLEIGGKRYAWVTANRQECVRFSEEIPAHGSIKVYDFLSIDYCEVP